MAKPPLSLQLYNSKTQGFSYYFMVIHSLCFHRLKNPWLCRMATTAIVPIATVSTGTIPVNTVTVPTGTVATVTVTTLQRLSCNYTSSVPLCLKNKILLCWSCSSKGYQADPRPGLCLTWQKYWAFFGFVCTGRNAFELWAGDYSCFFSGHCLGQFAGLVYPVWAGFFLSDLVYPLLCGVSSLE